MIKLNGFQVKYGVFPNGELYIDKGCVDVRSNNAIKFIYDGQADIIKLILLQSHIKECSAISTLHIQYLPYSRMDRKNDNYTFSLKAISDLINFLGFTNVIIREPHSIVSLNLITNSIEEKWCESVLEGIVQASNSNSIFFPDKGALGRYSSNKIPVAFGKKVRDFATGKINSLEITGDVLDNVLIVDDICSRGGTFIKASEKLRENGAKKVSLLVAYCEENVHAGNLFKHIDKLYTSRDCSVTNHPQIVKI